jgi:hypothetical protein
MSAADDHRRWTASRRDPRTEPDGRPADDSQAPARSIVAAGVTHTYTLDWDTNPDTGGTYTRSRCSCGRWRASRRGGDQYAEWNTHVATMRARRSAPTGQAVPA